MPIPALTIEQIRRRYAADPRRDIIDNLVSLSDRARAVGWLDMARDIYALAHKAAPQSGMQTAPKRP